MKYILYALTGAALIAVISFRQKNTGNGKIERIASFPSKYVKARNVDVWLPEGYNAQKKYPVIYMHDGKNLFNPQDAFKGNEWEIDERLSRLIAEGKIQECIVVGIWNTPDRVIEYAPTKPFNFLPQAKKDSIKAKYRLENARGDDYLKFIVQELKPYIDSAYSVCTKPGHTFIMGSSMGGLISLYALMEYPDVFGAAACISTHWTLGAKDSTDVTFARIMAGYMDTRLSSQNKPRLYFDFGTAGLDKHYEINQKIIDSVMRAKGFTAKNWQTLKFEGAGHNEIFWRERLEKPITFFLAIK